MTTPGNGARKPALDEGSSLVQRVRFDDGPPALLTTADAEEPDVLVTRIGLACGERPVIVVCGGTGDLTGTALDRAESVLGPAVASAAETAGAAVVDEGIASGVMAALGDARAQRPCALPVLLGVAPADRVSWPAGAAEEREALESRHTHFVLMGHQDGETGLLAGLAAALAGTKRVALVLAGGGDAAFAEALAAARRGWRIFAIEGTGGLADRIATQWHAAGPGSSRHARATPEAGSGPGLEEILRIGDIRPFTGDPRELGRQLAWELQDEPVLKAAWNAFMTYDLLAARMRRTFQWLQGSVLSLGVIATLLALIQHATGGPTGRGPLHWLVIVLPIAVSALVAWSNRQGDGPRWIMLRAAAEAVKSEIYRYRTRTEVFTHGQPDTRASTSRQMLQAHLTQIDARLVRSEASTAPLTPYGGLLPPQMYGASRYDDGLSQLTAEEYLQVRVGDQVTYYHRRIRYLHRLRIALELLAITAGAAGTLVAAMGADAWVGLTSGVAVAALAYLGYLQVENSVVAYNQAASNLTSLAQGWQARNPDQRSARAFGELVTSVESVLSNERAGWAHFMCEAMHELEARQQAAAEKVSAEVAPVPAADPGGKAPP